MGDCWRFLGVQINHVACHRHQTVPMSDCAMFIKRGDAPASSKKRIPNNKNSFTMAANKMLTLATEFRFPNSTTPWGIMTHFFIADALTGGNVWWSGRLIHSRNVELSTTLSVLPNGFQWILDSCTDVINPIIAPAMQPLAGGARIFWG